MRTMIFMKPPHQQSTGREQTRDKRGQPPASQDHEGREHGLLTLGCSCLGHRDSIDTNEITWLQTSTRVLVTHRKSPSPDAPPL